MKTLRLILAISLLVSIFGCAGAKYTDVVTPVDITKSKRNEVTTKVIAKADVWRNSGLIVKKGVTYRLVANGRWRISGLCNWTGADGLGAYTLLCFQVFPGIVDGWTLSALIAKIGEQGQPFGVGQEYEFVAQSDGPLFFRINDLARDCWDNEGHMNVRIRVVGSSLEMAKPQTAEAPPPTPEKPTPSKAVSPIGSGQNWAVIIGISKYKHSGKSGLTNLIFADDDAKAFSRVLRNLGWSESHIKLMVNEEATQRNIMIALESWLTKAGPNDQIVLFWAGHGFADPEDPEKVYFACYDTDISIPATGYRMDRVRAALEERKARNVVLLADTCHAGKLITRGESELPMARRISRLHRDQSIPKGWIFMVAADTDRKAIEHTSWTNGAFTHSLVKGLSGKADGFLSAGPRDGTVSMGELRAYLNSAMPEETLKVLGVAKRPVITTSSGDPTIWNLNLKAR